MIERITNFYWLGFPFNDFNVIREIKTCTNHLLFSFIKLFELTWVCHIIHNMPLIWVAISLEPIIISTIIFTLYIKSKTLPTSRIEIFYLILFRTSELKFSIIKWPITIKFRVKITDNYFIILGQIWNYDLIFLFHFFYFFFFIDYK